MPHCILEYSANLVEEPDWRRLLGEIHDILMATGEFALADIKSRVVRHEQFLIGDGADNRAFVTLAIQFLDGRPDDLKKRISDAAVAALVAAFHATWDRMILSVTVQICDIHRASYGKTASSPGAA